MKVVAPETYEHVLVNLPVEDDIGKHDAPSTEDTASVDSSVWYESDSVLSSHSSTSSLCTPGRHGKSKAGRRVSFSKIEVREYSVTVGDHPLCRDGLPLQLDWQHSDVTEMNMQCSREREDKYQLPRRLSYEEKRDRLVNIGNYEDQRDRNQKLGQVIQRMQSWWQEHPILPMPDLYHIPEEPSTSLAYEDDEDEANDFLEIPPPDLDEYVFYWRRNR